MGQNPHIHKGPCWYSLSSGICQTITSRTPSLSIHTSLLPCSSNSSSHPFSRSLHCASIPSPLPVCLTQFIPFLCLATVDSLYPVFVILPFPVHLVHGALFHILQVKMSNNTSAPPGILARQHLDYIIQEQARRDRRLNMADLRAFFYKRCVELRRPAEEELEEDVRSSSAQHHQQVDVLEDAAFPEFSLFGHIYTDIPDTDSDSSTEIFPFEEVSHEDSPGKPTADASANEASTAHTVSGSAPTGGIAFTKTSIIDNTTASKPASGANEWLLFEPEESVDLYDNAYESDQLEKMAMEIDTSAHQDAVSTGNEHTTVSLTCSDPQKLSFLLNCPNSLLDSSLPQPPT